MTQIFHWILQGSQPLMFSRQKLQALANMVINQLFPEVYFILHLVHLIICHHSSFITMYLSFKTEMDFHAKCGKIALRK